MKTCPLCGKQAEDAATRCRICGTDLGAPPAPSADETVARELVIEAPAATPQQPPPAPARARPAPHRPASSRLRGAVAGVVVLAAVTTLLMLERDKPAAVQLAVPQSMIFDTESVKPSVKIKNRHGTVLAEARFTLAATPADIVGVEHDGSIRCMKLGDATVTAAAGEVRSSLVVRCRPIADISGPAEIVLMLGAKPFDVMDRVAVLDDTGARHTDVPVALRSENESVFKVEDDGIVAVASGSATLAVSGGDESLSVPVSVVEKAIVRDATLPGRNRLVLQLAPGSYRVQLDPRDGSGATFAVVFAGASCESQDELPAFDRHCDFAEGGTLTIAPGDAKPGARLSLRISVGPAP